MPLPEEALHVDGGCNCGAIQYRLSIPPVSDRPLHPMAPEESPVSLPFIVLDHCNDCRRATGSVLPAWLCTPMEMASISLIPASSATLKEKAADRKGRPEEQRLPWMPALSVFDPTAASQDHFLRWYESSNERWRWFCSRCGTNIAYTAIYPVDFPNMLDITLGSVDRRHLEAEALVPERHLWWDYGIDWIQHLATSGFGTLPIHPNYLLTETIERNHGTSEGKSTRLGEAVQPDVVPE